MTDMYPRHFINHNIDFLDLSPNTSFGFAHSGEEKDDCDWQIDDFAENFQRIVEETVGERRYFGY